MNRIEQALQRALVQHCGYLRAFKDTVYHVPNGGKRRPVEAAILKGMGVRAGVSDLVIPVPILHRPLAGNESLGLYMELKAAGGRLTAEQRAWLERMRDLGHECHVIDSVDAGVDLLTDYHRRVMEARNG